MMIWNQIETGCIKIWLPWILSKFEKCHLQEISIQCFEIWKNQMSSDMLSMKTFDSFIFSAYWLANKHAGHLQTQTYHWNIPPKLLLNICFQKFIFSAHYLLTSVSFLVMAYFENTAKNVCSLLPFLRCTLHTKTVDTFISKYFRSINFLWGKADVYF